MNSIIAIFITLLLLAISATALAMPGANAPRTRGDSHDSQHLMRVFVVQSEAAQAQWT